jgi:hypothetical protein
MSFWLKLLQARQPDFSCCRLTITSINLLSMEDIQVWLCSNLSDCGLQQFLEKRFFYIFCLQPAHLLFWLQTYLHAASLALCQLKCDVLLSNVTIQLLTF